MVVGHPLALAWGIPIPSPILCRCSTLEWRWGPMQRCSTSERVLSLAEDVGEGGTVLLTRDSLLALVGEGCPRKPCGDGCGKPEAPPPLRAYDTCRLAERMGVSAATTKRRLEAGWFGPPEGLKPNGRHYLVPHAVVEDVLAHGPLCFREDGAGGVKASRAGAPEHRPAGGTADRVAGGATMRSGEIEGSSESSRGASTLTPSMDPSVEGVGGGRQGEADEVVIERLGEWRSHYGSPGGKRHLRT